MRLFMSACICLGVSMTAEARSKLGKIMSDGEPGTCTEISGLWSGECIEDGKPLAAKLQIFQDGCTDIAFHDFDSSIPQAYKTGREATVQSTRLADAFVNFTAYASWSADRLSFFVNRIFNFEYIYQRKTVRGNGEETYIVSLKAEELQTSLKGKGTSSSGQMETYETSCTYHRSN
ncbi:MAG TPA: hypothetical protein VE954_04160 [Oligoflexus sp.]|uniref:hypothetical protein n=1 Tax=Oligoflexus sp. TaxID=1971216 RepID=UPI002D5FBB1A|nr:hypothetical protein [Oligoflexus sp.]HYX32282.1 hypothetical protein [Oligoflexus sp.]